MAKAEILVVEDERITAKSIQNRLKKLGYDVPAVVSSGEEAIKEAAAARPDLVLMDIKLEGEMDGIQAAKQIRTRFNIPVIYLTAYADENTLQQAKVTEPYSYILKPFQTRELQTNIEVALYKHRMDMELRESEERHRILFKGVYDFLETEEEAFNPRVRGQGGTWITKLSCWWNSVRNRVFRKNSVSSR